MEEIERKLKIRAMLQASLDKSTDTLHRQRTSELIRMADAQIKEMEKIRSFEELMRGA